MSADATQAAASAGPPPQTREFDFWIGDWDVTWGEEDAAQWAAGPRGRNQVSLAFGGFVIQEQFASFAEPAFRGMSVSVYDQALGRWRQTWVDNAGGYLDFNGGWQDDRMVLSREALIEGRPALQRMVWWAIAADALEWNWERSDDGGATWRVLWQIHYRRRAGA